MNAKEEVVNKQIYKNYLNINGLNFPGEIINFVYVDGKESFQVTTFKNIKVNDFEESYLYNYPVPE